MTRWWVEGAHAETGERRAESIKAATEAQAREIAAEHGIFVARCVPQDEYRAALRAHIDRRHGMAGPVVPPVVVQISRSSSWNIMASVAGGILLAHLITIFLAFMLLCGGAGAGAAAAAKQVIDAQDRNLTNPDR